jgi:DNA-binding response OmpR family regulator
VSTKTILLVEDEQALADILKIRLEGQGYTVKSAMDGISALDMVKEEAPDLILLDIMLPKLHGYKVCQVLKHDQKYKSIPIVILSARSQKADIKMGFECGADAYLTKPFKGDELISTIKNYID